MNKNINKNLGMMNCLVCAKEIVKTGLTKKYCEDCRKERDIARIRRYEQKNPEKIRLQTNRLSKKWRENHKDIRAIYTRTNRKIKTNENCDICHSTDNLQKHHWRYDKPLLVNTLCQTCHQIQHIKHFEKSKFAREVLI